jgi:hypothetical protein
MVSGEKASRSQRSRWEGGRAALTRKYAKPLLAKGLRGDRVLLDLAADVLVPPLSRVALATAAGCAVSAAGVALWGGSFASAAAVFGASLLSLVFYVLRGWQVSGTGARGLADLFLAPGYVAWKLTLSMRSAKRDDAEWVRTRRAHDAD